MVHNVLSIFPTDIMRVDFYISKAGVVDKPQSYSLSPKDYSAVCNEMVEADEIACTDFTVYCTAPDDMIVTRVTGGGEFLYEVHAC